jgi:uncharacterized membrane protein
MGRTPIRGIAEEKYFHWRGKEVSRTENLSDIVFAMALTLIVASSVPESFAELSSLWREAIATALCFAMMLMIWHIHYIYFRRYDLEDGQTIFLNSILIFLVMIFAYPLKFLATFLVNFFTGGFAGDEELASVLSLQQAPWLTVVYALGYTAVFAVFFLLYRHAASRADDIGLDPAEQILTQAAVQSNFVHVCFGLSVAILGLVLPGMWGAMAGAVFGLIGIPLAIIGRRSQAQAKAANQEATQ